MQEERTMSSITERIQRANLTKKEQIIIEKITIDSEKTAFLNEMCIRDRCRADQDHCRRCIEACARKAVSKAGEGISIDRELCSECQDYACTRSCFKEALRLSGQWYEPVSYTHLDVYKRQS